jgi:hypothetical protein
MVLPPRKYAKEEHLPAFRIRFAARIANSITIPHSLPEKIAER